jgi:hypothetical protein|tara:strand:+ start:193 stop:342 length:150 start_codon:yes stop_codon:yes gene_type:complete
MPTKFRDLLAFLQSQKGPSGMPPGLQAVISKRELRDVIEYLASLKQAPK